MGLFSVHMRIRRSENIWRAYDNYWVLGLIRFSLVMRANWDFYECNKILSLHNNELPWFSHRIIIHTSNQPKHIFLSELNRVLCKCCSSSTVENDSITTRRLFLNYYLFFSCSCTIILLLITHSNNVLGWHCLSVLHICCPILFKV